MACTTQNLKSITYAHQSFQPNVIGNYMCFDQGSIMCKLAVDKRGLLNMEPITFAAIALAVVSGAGGKIGEKFSEGVIVSAQRLLELLKLRSPQTAKRLALAGEVDSDPDVIDVEIIEEVKRAVENDPEMQAAVAEISSAMQQQLGDVTNQSQLAEKIGVVIQGGYNPIRIDRIDV